MGYRNIKNIDNPYDEVQKKLEERRINHPYVVESVLANFIWPRVQNEITISGGVRSKTLPIVYSDINSGKFDGVRLGFDHANNPYIYKAKAGMTNIRTGSYVQYDGRCFCAEEKGAKFLIDKDGSVEVLVKGIKNYIYPKARLSSDVSGLNFREKSVNYFKINSAGVLDFYLSSSMTNYGIRSKISSQIGDVQEVNGLLVDKIYPGSLINLTNLDLMYSLVGQSSDAFHFMGYLMKNRKDGFIDYSLASCDKVEDSAFDLNTRRVSKILTPSVVIDSSSDIDNVKNKVRKLMLDVKRIDKNRN